jgi:hypothetical protein
MSVVSERPVAPVDSPAGSWSPANLAGDGCRLVWAPASDADGWAGAWWPRTREAEVALRELLPVVGERLGGAVVRVSLNLDAWDPDPPRRIRLDGRLVRLGWFHTLDPHVITLGHTTFDRLRLLVIPADTTGPAGDAIVTQLAAATWWPDSSSAALKESEAP